MSFPVSISHPQRPWGNHYLGGKPLGVNRSWKQPRWHANGTGEVAQTRAFFWSLRSCFFFFFFSFFFLYYLLIRFPLIVVAWTTLGQSEKGKQENYTNWGSLTHWKLDLRGNGLRQLKKKHIWGEDGFRPELFFFLQQKWNQSLRMMGIRARSGWKDELQPRQTMCWLDGSSVWFERGWRHTLGISLLSWSMFYCQRKWLSGFTGKWFTGKCITTELCLYRRDYVLAG